MPFTFGDHVVDIDRRELWRAGKPIPLEPQVFDVLVYLIRNRDRVVSKDELITTIWGGRIVSESSLTTCINAVRTAVGDTGAAQQIIRTMPRKGIRFVAEAREGIPLDESTSRPSIAVLPFTNMSGDPEQDYFVNGMVEEITVALSRIRWLVVLARVSSFTQRGQTIDTRQIGREPGVRYALEGSVRRSGDRVRITTRLIDVAAGAHLWADRFNGSLGDVFELQDRVATAVAGAIEPELQAAEAVRSARRLTADQTALDLYLLAYGMTVASSARIPEALRLMEQAIERDPRCAPALAWAAVCCARMIRERRSADAETDRMKGIKFARQALGLANDDPTVLVNAAYALTYFGEDVGTMIALIDRALTLNPSFARGWHVSGVVRIWAGQPEIAIEHAKTALRLSPRASLGASFNVIGAGLFYSRRLEEAIPVTLRMIQQDPTYPQAYGGLAACYAHLGRLDEARQVVRQLCEIIPTAMPDLSHMRNPEHRDFLLSGLRLALGRGM